MQDANPCMQLFMGMHTVSQLYCRDLSGAVSTGKRQSLQACPEPLITFLSQAIRAWLISRQWALEALNPEEVCCPARSHVPPAGAVVQQGPWSPRCRTGILIHYLRL